jgi:hypothetical protein
VVSRPRPRSHGDVKVVQKSPPVKSHNSSHTELHINLEILNKLSTKTLGYTNCLITTVFKRKQDSKNTSRYSAVSEYVGLLYLHLQYNSAYPDAGYPNRLGPLGKSVENSKKLTCLEITGYWIKYSTVLWFAELQIRRGRKVHTQIRSVKSNSQTSNCQCSPFSTKSQIFRIFCISG